MNSSARPFERLASGGPDHFDPDDFRELGVAVARVLVRHPRHYVYEALFERLVSELSRRLHGLPDPRAMEYLRTYDEILPISEFSDEWLERYWDVRGTGILYPPVDVGSITPRPDRDRVILGVGRFFEGSHNKKHDEMIRTFGELRREGALPGWELHLVGGSMPERRHQKYLDRCRALAAGLPVAAPASVIPDRKNEYYKNDDDLLAAVAIATASSTPTDLWSPAYSLYNAYFSYARKVLNRNTTFQLNVDNLLNKEYYRSAAVGSGSWGDPRTFRFTMSTEL